VFKGGGEGPGTASVYVIQAVVGLSEFWWRIWLAILTAYIAYIARKILNTDTVERVVVA
jgi:hypothetical protein